MHGLMTVDCGLVMQLQRSGTSNTHTGLRRKPRPNRQCAIGNPLIGNRQLAIASKTGR
jgi:hypothetical protein